MKGTVYRKCSLLAVNVGIVISKRINRFHEPRANRFGTLRLREGILRIKFEKIARSGAKALLIREEDRSPLDGFRIWHVAHIWGSLPFY